MNTEKIFELVDLYYDDELTKAEESHLFSVLAANAEGRDYFKKMQMLRNSVRLSAEDLRNGTDKNILTSIASQKKPAAKQWSLRPVHLAAAALVLVFLSVLSFLYAEVKSSSYEVQKLNHMIIDQQQTIEMLYNTLPSVTVSSKITY